MKRLIFITSILFLGCGPNFGTFWFSLTPQMKSYIEELKENNIPIMIIWMGAKKPNSDGGSDVSTHFRFTSKKPIKDIYTTFTAYNKANDAIKCEIQNRETITLNQTGLYVESNNVYRTTFKNAFYNRSIHCIELTSVVIVYNDDTEEKFEGNDVDKLIAPKQFRISFWGGCE